MAQTTTTPHLQVLPVTLEDISRISDIHLRAWLTNTLYRTIYFSGYTPTLLNANITRHTTAFTSDTTARYLKAVLNNQLIAWAKIHAFSQLSDVEQRKDTSERIWPDGINLSLVNLFWRRLQAARASYGPQLGPHVQVDLVATDPEFFKRGAGRALMREVVRIADAADPPLPCFIEGSPEGERLYESVGFVKVGEFWVDVGRFPEGKDLGDGWRGRDAAGPLKGEEGWYKQVEMIRPARGNRVEDYLGVAWEAKTEVGVV